MNITKSIRRIIALSLFLVCIMAMAVPAFAITGTPTMGLAELRTALDTNDSLDAYFLTVVKGGTITRINAKITSLPYSNNPKTTLIFFKSDDPNVINNGGIAEGMSGSPLYLSTGELVGAVSYGDYFALNGYGLATPIEAMEQISSSNARIGQTLKFDSPLEIDGTEMSHIKILSSTQENDPTNESTLALKPLAAISIGGLPASSRAYKRLAKFTGEKGFKAIPMSSSGGGDEGLFSTEITPGASMGAFLSRGAFSYGAIGTATYLENENVVGYGHPVVSYSGAGAVDLYLTNAYIQGILANSESPYKVGEIGATKGRIIKDHAAGIMGQIGKGSKETTITVSINNLDSAKQDTTVTWIPQSMFVDQSLADYAQAITFAAISGAFYDVADTSELHGSTETTITMVVSDGTEEHTVTVVDKYSCVYPDEEVTYSVVSMLEDLTSTKEWGLENLEVKSIHVASTYASRKDHATVVDINTPDGLSVGSNEIKIRLRVYGERDLKTVTTTLDIPAGTVIEGGTLKAKTHTMIQDEWGWRDWDEDPQSPTPWDGSVASIKDIAKNLNDAPHNTDIAVQFVPETGLKIEKVLPLGQVGYGSASAVVPRLSVEAMDKTVNYGKSTMLSIYAMSQVPPTISIYYKQPGDVTEKLLVKKTIVTTEDPEMISTKPIFGKTVFRIRVEAQPGYVAFDKYVTVQARASVKVVAPANIATKKAAKLTAEVRPVSTKGGKVTFEYYRQGKWSKIATKTLVASGSLAKATCSWKGKKGATKLRVRYLGGTLNVATTSSVKSVRVK